MAKILTVSANAKGLIFTDPDSNKSTSAGFEFHKPVDPMTAINAVKMEFKGRASVAAGTVSMMVMMLDNPRLDAYRGKCDCNEPLPAVFKAAVRSIEEDYVRALIVPPMIAKGATPGDAEDFVQKLLGDMKAGGSYAQAKGKIIAWFAYSGELPCFNGDTQKQLTVAAVEKLLANWKAQHATKRDHSFAARLVALADELEKRTTDENGKCNIQLTGETWGLPSAIAALKGMLATFEGLEREAAETATANHAGNINAKANAVIKAAKVKGEAQPA